MKYPETPMATFALGILNYWSCFHSHSPCTVVWKIQFTMSVIKNPHRDIIESNIFQHLVKMPTALTVCIIVLCIGGISYNSTTQIAKFMGPAWGPPGSCRPQRGPRVGPINLAIRACIISIRSICDAWRMIIWAPILKMRYFDSKSIFLYSSEKALTTSDDILLTLLLILSCEPNITFYQRQYCYILLYIHQFR